MTNDVYKIVCSYWPSHTGGYSSQDYARRIMCDFARSLNDKGIEAVVMTHQRVICHPIGSGPGGTVRCGDDWMPDHCFVLVPTIYYDVARKYALENEHVRMHVDICYEETISIQNVR
jgi:hypothetical protein